MALYLMRGRGRGEYEQKFLTEGRIWFTWNGFEGDLSNLTTLEEAYDLFANAYPEEGKARTQK